MRDLFTDGWNSLWHFMFGILGFYFGWVVVLFFAYQLNTPEDINLIIDISEFAIGYFLLYSINKTNKHPLLGKVADWFDKIRILKQSGVGN